MATITSGNFSFEIRYRNIDADDCIQYEAWLRFNHRPIINPAILSHGDSIHARDGSIDGIDDQLIPTLQSALETNQPRAWQAVEEGFSLYIYPDTHFPPVSKEDFDTSINIHIQKIRKALNVSLPDPSIYLYIQVDAVNLIAEERRSPCSLGIVLQVQRSEVQAFIDDLKYEYTDLLRLYPRHQDKIRQLKTLQLAFDGVPRILEVYFFQGDMTGWVHINLTVDSIQHTIWASHVFPPFKDLLNFLIAVAQNRLPCECWIDEEGREKIFHAEPWRSPDLIRFKLITPDKPLYDIHMDYVFDRRQFVLAFYNDLISFLNTHFTLHHWGHTLLVSSEDLENLRHAIDALGDQP